MARARVLFRAGGACGAADRGREDRLSLEPGIPVPAQPAAPSQTGAVLLGVVLTAALHVVASVAVVVVGSSMSREGGLVVLIFWATIGLSQWAYMLPAALLTRLIGWRGLSKGLWIGGAVGTLLSALCWGTIAAGNLAGAVGQRLNPGPAATQTAWIEGTLTAFDAEHLELRDRHGATHSVRLGPQTRYIRDWLSGSGGSAPATFEILAVPAAVRVTAAGSGAGLLARDVRVRVGGADETSPCAPDPQTCP